MYNDSATLVQLSKTWKDISLLSFNHLEQLRHMLTSPTQTGSRVGSRYTAISLEFLAPVANNVFEGLICTEWIPHCWSCGNVTESLLPCSDGIWSNLCVTTSYTISCEQFHTLMTQGYLHLFCPQNWHHMQQSLKKA